MALPEVHLAPSVPWGSYVDQVIARIAHCDFRVEAVTAAGHVRVFLVGDGNRSRAIALRSEDDPGVVCILTDDGSDPFTEWSELPAVAKTIGIMELTGGEAPYCTVEGHLELDLHRNTRLA